MNRGQEPVASRELLQAQRRVLRELARGAPLDMVLNRLALEAEAMVPGMRCTILLVRDNRLYDGAGPSMPKAYREAVHGLAIGPKVGSCGASAYQGQRVVARDILEHPNWEQFHTLLQGESIRACWSEPVRASTGSVVGTFAMYYAEPCEPRAFELEWIEAMAEIAAIAIEADCTANERRESDERFRQLAENVHEVFWLTELRENEKKILYISPTYETVYGRSCQSLYDEPRSWSTDIHPEDRQRVLDAFTSGATQGRFDVEYRILRPDGQMRWIHDRAFPISNANRVVYRVAGLSEDITERKLAELELSRALAELEARSQARESMLQTEILLAEERERRHLAVDLHDGLNQLLTLALMKLRAVDSCEPQALKPVLECIEKLIQQAEHRARTLTFQLSPPILHDLGFEPAVQWLAEDVAGSYGIRVDVDFQDSARHLDENVLVLLFRAVRELLINVAKHAKATRAVVRVRHPGDHIEVVVEDDGVAFDPARIDGRGLGLSSIRERLESLRGRVKIDSKAGKGTAITLLAPAQLIGSSNPSDLGKANS